jgi:hypothetical protein
MIGIMLIAGRRVEGLGAAIGNTGRQDALAAGPRTHRRQAGRPVVRLGDAPSPMESTLRPAMTRISPAAGTAAEEARGMDGDV